MSPLVPCHAAPRRPLGKSAPAPPIDPSAGQHCHTRTHPAHPAHFPLNAFTPAQGWRMHGAGADAAACPAARAPSWQADAPGSTALQNRRAAQPPLRPRPHPAAPGAAWPGAGARPRLRAPAPAHPSIIDRGAALLTWPAQKGSGGGGCAARQNLRGRANPIPAISTLSYLTLLSAGCLPTAASGSACIHQAVAGAPACWWKARSPPWCVALSGLCVSAVRAAAGPLI